MRKALPFLLSIGLFTACNKEKELSTEFLEDIKTGEVRLSQTGNGGLLYDSKGIVNARTTNRLLDDYKAQEWQYQEPSEALALTEASFNLPKDILKIEFVKEEAFQDTLSKVVPFHEAYYKQYPHLADSYKTYEDFKKASLTNLRNKPLHEINETLGLGRYHEPVEAKAFTYRIETTSGIERVNVAVYKVEGAWEIGPVTRTDI